MVVGELRLAAVLLRIGYDLLDPEPVPDAAVPVLLRKVPGSVVGDLIQNPENHVIEACVKGREIHVNVKPRTA